MIGHSCFVRKKLSFCIYIYTMILVTGGTGLVGRHLLLSLTQQEQPIKATYRDKKRIEEVAAFFAFAKAESQFSKVSWVKACITDVTALGHAFEGITHVYHCAALISFDPYQTRQLRKTNVEGTANVVNLCLANSIQKLCYASSIATLAQLPNNPVTEANFWDPNAQNTVYAISKYGAEMEVWRGSQEGLNVIIFNPGIILGEGNYDSGSGVLFKKVSKGLTYYPTGSSGFVDVKDVVALLIKGMQSDINKKRFILVGHSVSYKKVLQHIAEKLDVKSPKIALSKWVLKLGARLDFLMGLFTRKRRLTQIDALALLQQNAFSSDLAQTTFDYKPTPLQDTLSRISHHFQAVH